MDCFPPEKQRVCGGVHGAHYQHRAPLKQIAQKKHERHGNSSLSFTKDNRCAINPIAAGGGRKFLFALLCLCFCLLLRLLFYSLLLYLLRCLLLMIPRIVSRRPQDFWHEDCEKQAAFLAKSEPQQASNMKRDERWAREMGWEKKDREATWPFFLPAARANASSCSSAAFLAASCTGQGN